MRWAHADALLAEHAEYLALSPDAERRQELWREFLLGDDPHEEEVRRDDWAIGSDDFRRRVVQLQGRPVPRRRGRSLKQAARISTGWRRGNRTITSISRRSFTKPL